MHPATVMLSLVNASRSRVRPETSSWRHPIADHPSGNGTLAFDGGLGLALAAGVDAEEGVGVEVTMIDETEMAVASDEDVDAAAKDDNVDGGGAAVTFDWNAVNAQLPPQVLRLSPAQTTLQLDGSIASPAPFWKELPPILGGNR